MQAIGRDYIDENDLAYLKNFCKFLDCNNPSLPLPVPVTVTRGAFGPFPLTAGPLVTVGPDSPDSPGD